MSFIDGDIFYSAPTAAAWWAAGGGGGRQGGCITSVLNGSSPSLFTKTLFLATWMVVPGKSGWLQLYSNASFKLCLKFTGTNQQ